VAVGQQLRLRVLLLLHKEIGVGLLEVEAVVQVRGLQLGLEGQAVLGLVHSARVLAFHAGLLLVLQRLLGSALRNWVLWDRRRRLVQERQLLVVFVGRVYVPRVSAVLKVLQVLGCLRIYLVVQLLLSWPFLGAEVFLSYIRRTDHFLRKTLNQRTFLLLRVLISYQ